MSYGHKEDKSEAVNSCKGGGEKCEGKGPGV